MKAILALIVIYIGAFLIATQGSSQNTATPAKQAATTQTASIDPTKEADIRSLMELVGARDSVQDLATRGADQSDHGGDRGEDVRRAGDRRDLGGRARVDAGPPAVPGGLVPGL